jgi:RNA polymerase sigma factor (sigma-70 family)
MRVPDPHDSSADSPAPELRLDEISTYWSLLRSAHQGSGGSAVPARNALVMRYNGAIRKYLVALMGNEQEANEVAQEVVIRMLRGDFATATPERGRFRDYLKTAVRNEFVRYLKKKGRRAMVALDSIPEPTDETAAPPYAEHDQQWVAHWRSDLLEKTLRLLEDYQRQRPHEGNIYHDLMRLRMKHPENDNHQLALQLFEATGRRLSPEAFRGQLMRARRKFAELLLGQVAATLDKPTPEDVEEELFAVGLMNYVRDLLPSDWRTRDQF